MHREQGVTRGLSCDCCAAEAAAGLAAGAGVQEPSLAPAMAAATTFIAFVTAVIVPVAAAESGTRMVSPFCFPVSSQW